MSEGEHRCGAPTAFFAALFLSMVLAFAVNNELNKIRRRFGTLERIVGTETPASMTWTNGHTYSTIVKHSANCACVKK